MNKYNYTYKEYLNTQKEHIRTTYRTEKRQRDGDNQLIAKHFGSNQNILSVGTRHISEIEGLEKFGHVVNGFDLYSTHPRIKILDMHEICSCYTSNQFDIAYLCHSLEHSYDPGKVLNNLYDICLKGIYLLLPIMEDPTSKDPISFEFMKEGKQNKEMVMQEFDKLISKQHYSVSYIKRLETEFILILKWNKN